jgi:hypothetical protein
MSSPDLFYPQHFKRTRPYAKTYMDGLDELMKTNALNPKSSYNLSAKCILDAYKPTGIVPGGPNFNSQGFTVENQAALIYGEWVHRGAALYAFRQPLTEALLATGVGEISLNELHFPFDCAYFHFGPQPGLVLQSGASVTGAYVLWSPEHSLRISLAAPLPADTPWASRWAEVYDLRITRPHFGKNLESAILHALVDDAEDIRLAADKLKGIPNSMAESGFAAIEAFLVTLDANKETFSRCLQLIANAICYVTAFPDDALTTWQAGTPEKMAVKADTAAPKEASRAASKLNAMGYRKVRYIGGEFSAAASNTGGGQVSPHWRRGHWRSQAHGPQMSLRKLIWLKPTRVLGGAVSEEPRIYSTEKPGTSGRGTT